MVSRVVTCLFATLMLLVGRGSAEESVANTTANPSEPRWDCVDVPVQSNVTMQQVLGEWFMLELDDGKVNRPEDVCLKMSLTDLREETNNRSSVTLTAYKDHGDGSKSLRINYSAYFPKDKPGELVAADLNALWRVHSLTADGHLLVMAMCARNHNLYWMTLGVAEDTLPADVTPRSSYSIRRDANVCSQDADIRN